jgi:hypothetical protein
LEGVEQTYFSVLAKGQFKIQVDKDGAIFIDRSTFGFQVVWGHLLCDPVNLKAMSEAEREIVRVEAHFYQVHSLLKLLAPPPQFNKSFNGPLVSFTSDNTVVTRVAEVGNHGSYVISSTPFEIPDNSSFAEKKFKMTFLVGFSVFFGLAPAKLMTDPLLTVGNCGYHCSSDLYLWGESVAYGGVPLFDGHVEQNSVIQLRLHHDKTVSIVLDGEDLGVAFRDVNTAEPLYLFVGMHHRGDCVELLPELV